MANITKMLSKFLNEESGQTAIEYIMIAGGAILVTVVFFAVYSRMTDRAGVVVEAGANASSTDIAGQIGDVMPT